MRLAALLGNVAVPADGFGLPQDSVNVTQIATVARDILGERVAVLPPWLVTQVDDGLRRVLGL